VPNPPDLDELIARLDRIQQLTEELAKVRGDTVEQVDLAARIYREIEAARLALKAPPA
jgi:predicted transcriptional regulator